MKNLRATYHSAIIAGMSLQDVSVEGGLRTCDSDAAYATLWLLTEELLDGFITIHDGCVQGSMTELWWKNADGEERSHEAETR